MSHTILLKLTCTLTMFFAAALLVVRWAGELRGVDPVSVAVVFAGALIGRCVLERRSALRSERAAAPWSTSDATRVVDR